MKNDYVSEKKIRARCWNYSCVGRQSYDPTDPTDPSAELLISATRQQSYQNKDTQRTYARFVQARKKVQEIQSILCCAYITIILVISTLNYLYSLVVIMTHLPAEFSLPTMRQSRRSVATNSPISHIGPVNLANLSLN